MYSSGQFWLKAVKFDLLWGHYWLKISPFWLISCRWFWLHQNCQLCYDQFWLIAVNFDQETKRKNFAWKWSTLVAVNCDRERNWKKFAPCYSTLVRSLLTKIGQFRLTISLPKSLKSLQILTVRSYFPFSDDDIRYIVNA